MTALGARTLPKTDGVAKRARSSSSITSNRRLLVVPTKYPIFASVAGLTTSFGRSRHSAASGSERGRRLRQQELGQVRADEHALGEHVERGQHFCQKKSTGRRSEESRNVVANPVHQEAGDRTKTILEKVRLALRNMGFRGDQARRAILAIARMREANEPFTTEQALREALLVATAA